MNFRYYINSIESTRGDDKLKFVFDIFVFMYNNIDIITNHYK
jgi:hypothetical protein